MRKTEHIALITLVALLLGACSSAAEPTATLMPTDTQAQPTATERPTAAPPTGTPTLPPPTATQDLPEPTSTQSPAPPTDTPAVEEEEDIFAFLQVGPDEWVRGPDDAAVTIVEYADFQ